MSRAILTEDWSDYDNKKKKYEDRFFFSCEEKWEVDYLVGKIHKKHPELSTERIREAIGECCKTVHGNKPRVKFVNCVTERLGVGDDNGGGNPPQNPGQGPKNPPTPPGDRTVG